MKILSDCSCRLFLLSGLFFLSSVIFAQSPAWPILKHYENRFIEKVAMPVGGIGTGNISIAGNGQWKDVEIMNKPGVGFYGSVTSKQAPCFMVFTENEKGVKKSKALIGPVAPGDYAGSEGSTAPNHGLPRFSTASFDAGYPFAIVNLDDDGMPVSCKAKVFNPFIPGDPIASGIPIAVIRYEVKNKTNGPLTIAVAGSLDNFIGMDGSSVEFNSFNRAIVPQGTRNNRNDFRRTRTLAGIFMSSDSVDRDSNAWGTIALTTPLSEQNQITYRTQFNPKGWNANITDMWDDFSDDGSFKDISFSDKVNDPRAALSVKFTLAPNETKEVAFFLTWVFPNRKDWNDKITIGNYYANFYKDAWEVIEKTQPLLPALEAGTADFVDLIAKSDYPAVMKEAALFNSSTLRSQTTFRDKQGYFFGWEGVFASTGSCYGNCTHVWNYEQASPFLFGELAMKMREVEYEYALDDSTGLMSFRVSLPFNKKSNWGIAAADGQMGTIMKVYREWQLSGNNDFLKKIYPGLKKAISFAWIADGWDANKDGVMEGCQHNTMDIEYFGPNPEIEFWYLGALKAMAGMAKQMKDASFEKTCIDLFNKGSEWTDKHLFNGEFYYQQIQPLQKGQRVATGLMAGMGSRDILNPDFQIGEGCLVDQLVGQNMAFICGLGYLADSTHVKKAMQSIWKYNHIKTFGDQFNNMRSYALGEEAGLMLTAYPDPAKRPKIPLSYGFEAWTGLEYTAATGMLYQGMETEALQVITDVRNRYDGLKRNPFNEEECGNHYARAMASWSALLAYSGFNYSAVRHEFSITDKPGKYFWSNGYSWGSAVVKGRTAQIAVHHGNLALAIFRLGNNGPLLFKKEINIAAGNSVDLVIP